jgi:arylsulfatase A-like enzyme
MRDEADSRLWNLTKSKLFVRISWATLTLALAAGLLINAVITPGRSAAAAPNVLFIVADDLNDWIGCWQGHPQTQTPHLDRLAARGTRFRNAHVQAPLCNPSRVSVMTGLRPSTTGVYGLVPGHRNAPKTQEAVTLPQHFEAAGYHTASFGKVFHHNPPPARRHPREFTVWGLAPPPKLPARKFVATPDPEPWMDWGVFPPDDTEQGDWRVADAAIAEMRNRPARKPFFLAVGFSLPHVPCYVSQGWFDRFPPEEQIQLPPFLEQDRADVPDFAWLLHWQLPEPRLSWLRQAGQWRPLVRAYLASIAFMDSQVGRLLESLERENLASNTVVVFWSDYGWHLGEKDITGKCSLWERSTRVPLIFAGPGVARAATCDQPVELLDLYPTLIELCGLPRKTGLEGQSLGPQLRNAQRARRHPAITTHNRGNHAVRSEHWRYIRYADGSQELYDLRNDPNEWTNRVADPQLVRVVRDHARWLPKVDEPPAPGSAHRILTQTNGDWYWEGKRVEWNEVKK